MSLWLTYDSLFVQLAVMYRRSPRYWRRLCRRTGRKSVHVGVSTTDTVSVGP